MKILLQSFSFRGSNGYYKLGILYLKSALLAREQLVGEVEVKLLQSDYFDPVEQVFEAIRDYQPDVLGLSVFIWSVDLTEALLRKCSELERRPIIVCGGTGLISLEREFLQRNREVDLIVTGAGEQTFVELIEHFMAQPAQQRRLGRIPGLTYRDEEDSISETQRRELNIPLAALPSPYVRGFHEPGTSPNYLILETDRYCPYRCAYCTWADQKKAHPHLRFPIERVRADLFWAERNGCDVVSFFDSAINYDSERLVTVLDAVEAVSRASRSIEYFFFLKFDFLDRVQLERLIRVRTPCLVFLGVESFSPAGTRFRTDAARHGLLYRQSGIPLLVESHAFPEQELARVYDVIDSRIPTGRISLNPVHVPIERLRNPEILPPEVRKAAQPDSWIQVGVVGIGGGQVIGRGYYPEVRPNHG